MRKKMQFWRCIANLLCTLFTYKRYSSCICAFSRVNEAFLIAREAFAVTTHNFNLIFCHFYIILIRLFFNFYASMHSGLLFFCRPPGNDGTHFHFAEAFSLSRLFRPTNVFVAFFIFFRKKCGHKKNAHAQCMFFKFIFIIF